MNSVHQTQPSDKMRGDGALALSGDALDAVRYRYLRNLAIEQTGQPGQPCIAMPNGMKSGYYLTEETADHAIDTAMQERDDDPLSCTECGWTGSNIAPDVECPNCGAEAVVRRDGSAIGATP